MNEELQLRPNCIVCRGACCEEFSLPDTGERDDASRWFKLHASDYQVDRVRLIRFECRCTKLDDEGLCSIYEDRPNICRTFTPGSERCLDVIRRRRPIEERRRILGES